MEWLFQQNIVGQRLKVEVAQGEIKDFPDSLLVNSFTRIQIRIAVGSEAAAVFSLEIWGGLAAAHFPGMQAGLRTPEHLGRCH